MRFLFQCHHGLKTWGGSSTSSSLILPRARRVCLIYRSRPRFSCRTFASITPPALVEDEVEVPVGGNGLIKLNVLKPATDNAKANPNVILYLPRGPIFEDESVAGIRDSRTIDYFATHDESIITEPSGPFGGALSTAQEVMAAVTGANIVTLNYRIGYTDGYATMTDLDDKSRSRMLYRYPIPVHDTLAGVDWILQTLRPEKLFVFGSNIGGSLATMLALTESEHIHAVAVHEPVCDWTGLDDYCTIDLQSLPETAKIIPEQQDFEDIESQNVHSQPVQTKQNSRHKKKTAPFDLVPLLKTREYLFDSPSKYFDAFASPTLFLRSAGKDVPKTIPKYHTGPEYPTPVLKNPVTEDDIDLWDIHMQPEDEMASTENSGQTEQRPSRRRKALSRWPPYGLDYRNPSGRGFSKATRLQITLPYVKFFARFSSGEEAPAPSNQGLTDTVTEPESESEPEGSDIPRPKRRPSPRKSTTEHNSVLGMQAKEMVSVMRRACFWGEEAGKGEDIVTLRSLPLTATIHHDAAEQQQQQLTDPNYLETAYESAHWFRDLTHSSR